jgi:hypothetical protein
MSQYGGNNKRLMLEYYIYCIDTTAGRVVLEDQLTIPFRRELPSIDPSSTRYLRLS